VCADILGVEEDLFKRMLFHVQDDHVVVALNMQSRARAKYAFMLLRVFSLHGTKRESEYFGAHILDRVVPIDLDLHPIIGTLLPFNPFN